MVDSELSEKYPSLELLYEHTKDILSHETQALSDMSLKATFLWGAITAVIGIAIPLVYLLDKTQSHSSLLTWILSLYGRAGQELSHSPLRN